MEVLGDRAWEEVPVVEVLGDRAWEEVPVVEVLDGTVIYLDCGK